MRKQETKQKYPLVEVIILHHNNKTLIGDCLRSLIKTKYSNLKITVIDNASSDDSVAFIREKFPLVNIIENKENFLFAAANNIALKKTKAKYAILLNNDTEQEPDWISELVKIAEKKENGDVAALQPKFLDLKNKKNFEYAGAAGGFIDIYGYPVCQGRIFDNIEEDKGQYDEIREIFWSCGAAMLIRMSVLKKIGYLDETIGAYAEELDLSWRMNLAGYRLLYVPKAVIYHLGSKSWGEKRLKFTKIYLIHRNHWIILFKNYEVKTWFKILPMKALLEGIAFFGFLFKEPKRSLAIAKVGWWILTHPAILLKLNKEVSKLKKVSDNETMDKMIRKSVAFDYHVLGNKRKFNDYAKFIRNFSKY